MSVLGPKTDRISHLPTFVFAMQAATIRDFITQGTVLAHVAFTECTNVCAVYLTCVPRCT